MVEESEKQLAEDFVRRFEELQKTCSHDEIKKLLQKLEAKCVATPKPALIRSPLSSNDSRPTRTIPRKITHEALPSSESAWTTTQRATSPQNVDLSELYKSEVDSGSDGYSMLQLEPSYSNVEGQEISRGTVQQQCYRQEGGLLRVVEAEKFPRSLSDDEKPFIMPPFHDTTANYDGSDLEAMLEERMASYLEMASPQEYLIASTHTSESRKRLGLPESSLQAGHRLMCTREHYSGIHSSWGFISGGESVFELHSEDFWLKSANILYAGAPKLWVIIDPRYMHKLEGHLAEHLNITPKCSQFVRHQRRLLPPSLLRRWQIRFSIILQKPGCLVLVDYYAYHYGVNLGPNIAEAINYANDDWIVPPTYQECSKRQGCGNAKSMTVASMRMGEFRPLNVVDFEKPQVQPYQKKRQHKRFSYSRATGSEPHAMDLRPHRQGHLSLTANDGTRQAKRGTGKTSVKATPNTQVEHAPGKRTATAPELKDAELPAAAERDTKGAELDDQSGLETKEVICSEMIEAGDTATSLAAPEDQPDLEKDDALCSEMMQGLEIVPNNAAPEDRSSSDTALCDETIEVQDTAIGDAALEDRSSSDTALCDETIEVQDTAIGDAALEDRSSSDTALYDETIEVQDTAIGDAALEDRLSSDTALCDETIEVQETAIGDAALEDQLSLKKKSAQDTILDASEGEDNVPLEYHDVELEKGNYVQQIRSWISFATTNYKPSSWAGFLNTASGREQVENDLSRFDPERKPVESTWFSDRLVFYLLHHFFRSADKAQVVDPICLMEAVQQQDIALLNIDRAAKLIVAPCHIVNHWCLLVIHIEEGKLHVYDVVGREKNEVVNFLQISLQFVTGIQEWDLVSKPVSHSWFFVP